jgi:hypothetical protein
MAAREHQSDESLKMAHAQMHCSILLHELMLGFIHKNLVSGADATCRVVQMKTRYGTTRWDLLRASMQREFTLVVRQKFLYLFRTSQVRRCALPLAAAPDQLFRTAAALKAAPGCEYSLMLVVRLVSDSV